MRALDLFRGAGGWSVACQHLGIEDHGVEIMPQANETALAAGHNLAYSDVWAPASVPTFGEPSTYDGLIASPPCQTFSQAGKGAGRKALDAVLELLPNVRHMSLLDLQGAARVFGDERTALVLSPLLYAFLMRPRWIAWEQVPTVLPVWEACADQLRSVGYSVWTGNLQAEQYGVPQTRKRAILIASRVKEVGMPEPTHSKYYPRSPEKLNPDVKKWVSMAEALGWEHDFTQRSNYNGHGPSGERLRASRSSHEPSSTLTSKGFQWMFAGAGGTSELTAGQVPREMGQPAHTVTSKATAAWVYRGSNQAHAARRGLDDPAPTVNFGARSNKVEWMPEHLAGDPAASGVRVSVREAGILQSFPADYPWQGAKTKQYLQVGNAIPPLLAEAILSEATS